MAKRKQRVRIIKAILREIESKSTHDWDMTDYDRGICQRCGLQLIIKTLRKLKGVGYIYRPTYGGNEYGIGGLLKEPACPRRKDDV